MKYFGAAILFAMAAAATAQSKSEDAAAVREAIRFERAKDAAAKRQVSRAPVTPKTKESVADAIAFERAKDAAAARQARMDAQSSADRSVANAGRRK
jgi:hypothetical protein